jgi:ketosteroid isomerase-like protein
MVRLRLSGRGAASGVEVEQYAAALARVADGRVTRIEVYPDLEAARAALHHW